MQRLRLVDLMVLVALAAPACDRVTDSEDTERTSAVKAVVETPEQAAVRRHLAREERRATIESLKTRVASMPSSAERQAVEQQLRATYAEHVANVEGATPLPGPLELRPSPSLRTRAQNDALIAKIGKYDMTNPADVAEWSRVKTQELGQ